MPTETDWRDLPPVPKAERPERNGRASQSLLARQAVCPRSALFYIRHGGGVGSHAMCRGSAFHEFARRATLELIGLGEPQMPSEVAKDLMVAVVDDHPEWTVPPLEMDRLRVMAHHWSAATVLDLDRIVAVEQMFELDLGGWTVRGRVDLVLTLGERTIGIRDYKTPLAIPSQEQFDAGFQTILYALLVADGVPLDPCSTCENGKVWPDHGMEAVPCPDCDGAGETRLPSIGGEHAHTFDLAELYPMYLWDNPVQIAHRGRLIARPELIDHRLYVEGLLGHLDSQFETGLWPAVPGSHCSTCPARHDCPLPEAVRGEGFASDDDAETAATEWFFTKQRTDDLFKSLRAHASHDGPVRLGTDLVLDFSSQESRRVDYEGLERAVEQAVEYGAPFDLNDWIKVSRSTRFGKRKAEPGEFDEELSAAERWGEDAPW